MEWNEKLQAILDYVENHLQRMEEPIDREEVSRLAGCSFGFFQKVFSYMNEVSFSDYVRFRKLTLAGYDLKSTDMKIIDISYRYGYDSPTSFTKAFQQFHGVTPKDARSPETKLRVVPRMPLTHRMEYSWRMEHREAFRLIGKTVTVSALNGSHYEKIPEFWEECRRNGVYSRLVSMDSGTPKGLFGLLEMSGANAQELEYSVLVRSDGKVPEGFCEIMIPENTWAVFDCRGRVPEAIQNGWKFLNMEWLLKYPFQHASGPELEWYSDGSALNEEYLSQIWIPIMKED